MPIGSVALTGDDTLVINGRVYKDFADGDSVHVAFANDLVVVKRSKNGNAVYAKDEKGNQTDVTVRLILGSPDDRELTSIFQQMNNDFAAFNLMSGGFSKRVGDGKSNVSTKVDQMAGGVIKKPPEAKTSSEGDVAQSVAEWNLVFADAFEVVQ